MTPASAPVTSLSPGSRAVLRMVEAGSYVDCAHCGDRVKFQAKARNAQVICNVYVGGKWDRVEHYHHHCYLEAEMPYGDCGDEPIPTPRASRKAS